MTIQGQHEMTFVDYNNCEPGEYVNVFHLTDQTGVVVQDTNGVSYSTTSTTYYNNIGGFYDFGTDYVTSNNRHEYPDNGYKGKKFYILHPELTKFIEYTKDTDITLSVVLDKDRYKYSHNDEYFNRDTSLYNTVVGTISSTNESSIPDASWRTYKGIYYGESIPFLNIVEQHIPPSDILGVPTYDKQINTSDTLKYGTVASAATTFVLNMPVDDAMVYNNELLILFYDFKMDDNWTRMGFFYVDSVESIDEYTSRITAHDEAYKLNKYVDRFLEGYGETISLRHFFYELLDYCGCYYDSAMPAFQHSEIILDNIYHAVKTTGTEVAHQIATIVPAFIHADIDSDIIVDHYNAGSTVISVSDYTELTYCAYNSALVDKVKITSSNNVVAEDSHSGDNVYYLADNPLLNMTNTSQLNAIANGVWVGYTSILPYRPATVKFLYIPNGVKMGYSFVIKTPTNQSYRVMVMAMKIDAGGVTIESYGTQQFPVEASGNSEFINILNDITTEVGDIGDETIGLARIVNETSRAVDAMESTVSGLSTTVGSLSSRMGTAEGNITTLASTVSTLSGSVASAVSTVSSLSTQVGTLSNTVGTLSNTVAAMTVTASNNLASITMNGRTVSQLVQKEYVDSAVGSPFAIVYGELTLTTGGNATSVMFMGDSSQTDGIFVPTAYTHYIDSNYIMGKINNGLIHVLSTSSGWEYKSMATFTPNNYI